VSGPTSRPGCEKRSLTLGFAAETRRSSRSSESLRSRAAGADCTGMGPDAWRMHKSGAHPGPRRSSGLSRAVLRTLAPLEPARADPSNESNVHSAVRPRTIRRLSHSHLHGAVPPRMTRCLFHGKAGMSSCRRSGARRCKALHGLRPLRGADHVSSSGYFSTDFAGAGSAGAVTPGDLRYGSGSP
jgi:hypothetical protein